MAQNKVKSGQKAILALKNATGLTTNEAKTVVYWAIATQGLEKFDCFPQIDKRDVQGYL